MMNPNRPNKNDVLCGRGGLSNHHPGNRLFRRLIQANKSIHQRLTSTSQKQNLYKSIIVSIHSIGGRFVRKEDGEWIEITCIEATAKVSQALREPHDLTTSIAAQTRQSSTPISSSVTLTKQDVIICKQANTQVQPDLRASFSLTEALFSVAEEIICPSSVEVSDDEDDYEPISIEDILNCPSEAARPPVVSLSTPSSQKQFSTESLRDGTVAVIDDAANDALFDDIEGLEHL